MAKVTKNIVDKDLRDKVFDELIFEELSKRELEFTKINDRQYGCIMTDLNGNERYVRIGAIVAEIREDMTAEELMQSEVDKYNESIVKKAELAAKRKAKAEEDERKRALKRAEQEGE